MLASLQNDSNETGVLLQNDSNETGCSKLGIFLSIPLPEDLV